jgi:hypothetical protein
MGNKVGQSSDQPFMLFQFVNEQVRLDPTSGRLSLPNVPSMAHVILSVKGSPPKN